MANPVVPWEIQSLVPDEDAPRITQNFSALTDWGTYEVAQTRHFQVVYQSVAGIGAGLSTSYALTWPTAFPTGVTPVVLWAPNHTIANPAGVARATASIYSITNTGCGINVFNNHTAAFGAGAQIAVVAMDLTFNTTT